MAAFEAIGKRKMGLDQLHKGLKTLGVHVLEMMEKYPQLFEDLFHPKPLTPLCVRENLLFPQRPNEEDHSIIGMLIRFVDQSCQERLQCFLKFCIGGNDIGLIQGKKIAVEFHNQIYIQASTCSLKLQLPTSISSYDLFEMALQAVLVEKVNVEKHLQFHNSIVRFSVEQTVKSNFYWDLYTAFIGQFPVFEFC